jgi:hypothetical protein
MPPPSSSSVKATKKSAFSCDPCRKRKVRCQGEQPNCSRCTARGDVCVYKLTPTISYTQTLEKRVKELELLLSEQRRIESRSGAESPRNAASPAVSAAVSALPGTFEGLKLDDRGKITYHGATSFFQLPTPSNELDGSSNDTLAAIPLSDAGESRRDRLVSNAWQQRALETLSETPVGFEGRSAARQDNTFHRSLSNFYLMFIGAGYNPCLILYTDLLSPVCISFPFPQKQEVLSAILGDMEALGPYYSHTLLNAMLSHSIRWCKNDPQIRHLLAPYDDGLLFSRQARTLLFEELRQGHSTVPTVQTLLLLSAQECSAGNRTQVSLFQY